MSRLRSAILRLLPGGLRRALRGVRGRRRMRPKVLRAIETEFVAEGRPLATVGVGGGSTVLDGGVRSPSSDLAASLLASRAEGPRLLEAREWSDLAELGSDGSTPWPDTLDMLRRFATARSDESSGSGGGPRRRIVIDVRPLQSGIVNGTVTHARNVIEAVLDAIPSDVEAEAFVDPERPVPDGVPMDRFAATFDAVTIDEVAVFIEPSPLEEKIAAFDLDTRPGIVRIGVWLDAIIGSHPEAFLPLSTQVFGYQYSLECVGILDHVLALSEVSRDEAIAMGVDPDRVAITGCRSSLEGVDPSDEPLPFDRFILVAGSAAPHKDLGTGLIGALPSLAVDDGLGVVMIASPNDAQIDAIERILESAGLARNRCRIESQVPVARMAQLFASAEVVVVPSRHEGFSLPVVEAIGLGTPVVVSDIPAHLELLGTGRWTFPVGDPVALSRAVRSALRDRRRWIADERAALADRHDPGGLDRVVGDVVRGVIGAVGNRSE